MSEVAISGVGCVAASGCGLAAMAAALASGRSCFSEIDRSAGYHLAASARLGALADPYDPSPWLPPLAARRMSPPSRLAVVAARIALEDAGFDPASDPEPATAVVLATGYGPVAYTERILRQVLLEGPQNASPMLFAESVANAPAAQVALRERALGANLTVTQRAAGALMAVAHGAAAIERGRARRALVGGVDELTPLLHAILDRFHALARARGGVEAARPFDRDRCGYVAGEGATVLVLERADDVRARGRRPRAIVRASAQGFDPSAPSTGWGQRATRLAEGLRRRIERAGARIEEIDRVVSGADGARAGDLAVATTLRTTFAGRSLPPIVTPAACLGAYCGNTLGAAVLALDGAPTGPTPGFLEQDPELAVWPHDGAPLPRPRSVLVEATAVGGAAAWLVLEQPR